MVNTPGASKYLPLPTMKTNEDFKREVYEKYVQNTADACIWAVFDKTVVSSEEEPLANYAGAVSLANTSPENAVTEIGITVFPQFQRTHVASNAIGLVLLWTLDPPSKGGLGLRRVEWLTHSMNEGSRRVAERMGFELEGILRWQRALPEGAVGMSVVELERRNGTNEEKLGRHTAIYSIVWDEWEEKRPNVVEQMGRRK